MGNSMRFPAQFQQTLRILRQRWLLWAPPLVVCTLAAIVYGLVREPVWEASVPLVVRDEAVGDLDHQGRFDSTEAMKTAQETILEIATHPRVVGPALEEVGPLPRRSGKDRWPDERDIEDAQEAIRVTAPKGTEFGQTEMIYLLVRQPDRARAIALAGAVSQSLQDRLQWLRDRRAQSLIDELQKTVKVAQNDLSEATSRLRQMETLVGSDLGELRMLNHSGTGDSNLRASLNQIKEELREAEAALLINRQQQELLSAALEDPNELVATPNQLLQSQPALRRLKDGLVDAQLRTAEMMGKMSPDHPLVQAAVTAEDEVRQHLHGELEVALRGAKADARVTRGLVDSLQAQLAEVRGRLDRLAALRAEYGNLVAEVGDRTETLNRAHQALADARASQSAARSTSLVTVVDDPQTGTRPLGPGRVQLAAGGLVGGVMIALGLLLLAGPLDASPGRRWYDRLPFRRRAEDRMAGVAGVSGTGRGRRAEDRAAGRRDEDRSSGRRASDPAPTAGQALPDYGRRRDDVKYGRRSDDDPPRRRAEDQAADRRSQDEASQDRVPDPAPAASEAMPDSVDKPQNPEQTLPNETEQAPPRRPVLTFGPAGGDSGQDD